MQRVLSFDQSPALAGPLRFFLSAPLFAALAALVLLWHGADAMNSRWAPATLALTHLMTLGFLVMTIAGALMQILPVVAGAPVPRPAATATVVHALLTAGTLLLAAAFLLSQPICFRIAVACLAAAFGWLLAMLCIALLKAHANGASATVAAIRMALSGLAVTAAIGIALGSAFGWGLVLPVERLANLHAGWGLAGTVAMLIAGVAFQVIPMFQSTKPYPRLAARGLPLALFVSLLAWSAGMIGMLSPSALLQSAGAAGAALCVAGFGCVTACLLYRRKRSADITTRYWWASIVSLIACAALELSPLLADQPARPLLLGVLFIAGFAGSAVNGMLYKIVPFLVWYHLQNLHFVDRKSVPNIRSLLDEKAALLQFGLYVAAIVLCCAAALAPVILARAAALLFGIASLWLWFNLRRAARTYWRLSRTQPS